MYQYTFSNKDTEELTEKTKNYSNMLQGFEDVDKKFSSQDEGSLNLEKKTFEKLSDEEIAKKAENSLSDYKNSELENINSSYDDKKQSINEEINTTKTDGEAQKNETKKLYSSLKQEASNDAVKRGLSRSSIVINILDAFDQNMIKEYNKINDEITSKIDSLNNQKNLLNEQRENALNAFDITYAVKLSNKIDEINQSLLEEEQKVLEYNNQIAQKEAEYEAERKQNALDYAEYVEKYGYEGIEKMKQEEKYQIAKDYLMSMSKEEALNELNSNRLFNSELGSINFNKLKVLLSERKD